MIDYDALQHSDILIAGQHDKMIQNILDYEFLSQKSETSLKGIVNSVGTRSRSEYFWGSKVLQLPVYQSLIHAKKTHPSCTILINALSHRSAPHMAHEALEQGFQFMYVMAEGIPERDSLALRQKSLAQGAIILGPASIGFLYCGHMRLGLIGGPVEHMKERGLFTKGCVNLITRSGGLFNEIASDIFNAKLGLHSGAAIGGDRFPGSGFVEHIMLWDANPDVKVHVMVGEVGGDLEYEVVDALKSGNISKPVIAYCIGSSGELLPKNVQFGHAGAKAHSSLETAHTKNAALHDAGAIVTSTYGAILQTLKDFKAQSGLNDFNHTDTPELPMTLDEAIKTGKVRKIPTFVSTISSDRGDEATYGTQPISYFADPANNLTLVDTITQLWFKRIYPKWASKFLEIILITCADHGPLVSGAHNARVTARAGKDIIDSWVSGLLTIGPRFGGANDDAAKGFFRAWQSMQKASDFVQQHKQSGTYIAGIGHKIKTIHNPDKRVLILDEYSFANFPQGSDRVVFDFAKSVEAITTAKKDSLILNVDGAIGALMCDMWLQLGYSHEEIEGFISSGVLNALFAFSRSIGFIGHFLDEKRQNSPLYRHDPHDVLFSLD